MFLFVYFMQWVFSLKCIITMVTVWTGNQTPPLPSPFIEIPCSRQKKNSKTQKVTNQPTNQVQNQTATNTHKKRKKTHNHNKVYSLDKRKHLRRQSRRGGGCPGRLWISLPCRFSGSYWIKCWPTWCDLTVQPLFSGRWDHRHPGVPSNLNYFLSQEKWLVVFLMS